MPEARISQCEAARRLGRADRTVRRYVAAKRVSVDAKRRVLLSEVARVSAEQQRRGRRKGGMFRGCTIADIRDGRVLTGSERQKAVSKLYRILAVRALARVLDELKTSGNLDAAVLKWTMAWAKPKEALYSQPVKPLEKQLSDALRFIASGATIRVLTARFLAEAAKHVPCQGVPVKVTSAENQMLEDFIVTDGNCQGAPVKITVAEGRALPAGVMIWGGGIGVCTKLKEGDKIVVERSEEKAERICDQLSNSKLGQRALGHLAARETTLRYKFAWLLGYGKVSRRMACYWWGKVKKDWPRFRAAVEGVLHLNFEPPEHCAETDSDYIRQMLGDYRIEKTPVATWD
jgi:hypothetical protein